jgi:ribose/xylose/arabinose/galactoside ABC-type transport system permease subunit
MHHLTAFLCLYLPVYINKFIAKTFTAMNFKLLLQLSIFGLIMAFGTISLIPENIEPFFWAGIFIFCAVIIAKACPARHFWHGFALSLINSIWITVVHVIFYDNYLPHHPNMSGFEIGTHPRVMMILMAPLFGIIFGLIQGVFACVASKLVKVNQPY